MAFTRDRIQTILSNETLTMGERVDQVFAMHGQALSEGYISKKEAEQMRDAAVKAVQIPDPKESNEYKALQAEYDSYKTKQTARTAEEYKGIKPKFFDAVYDAIDRKEGAKPVKEQIEAIKKDFAEYFETEVETKPANPSFAGGTEGEMPKGGSKGFDSYWGFKPKEKE